LCAHGGAPGGVGVIGADRSTNRMLPAGRTYRSGARSGWTTGGGVGESVRELDGGFGVRVAIPSNERIQTAGKIIPSPEVIIPAIAIPRFGERKPQAPRMIPTTARGNPKTQSG